MLLSICTYYIEYHRDLVRHSSRNYWYEIGTKFDESGNLFDEPGAKYNPERIKYRP